MRQGEKKHSLRFLMIRALVVVAVVVTALLVLRFRELLFGSGMCLHRWWRRLPGRERSPGSLPGNSRRRRRDREYAAVV